MTARGRRRATRLAVMALVVTLAGVALLTQPAPRDGGPARLAAIVPAPAGVGPAGDVPATTPRATAGPAEAADDSAPADPAVVAEVEREAEAALPAVPEPGDIVVALVTPVAESVPGWTSYVSTSESAQPEGPPPLGGAADSGEGAEGPEAGALYWFGPEGLVRLAREARR